MKNVYRKKAENTYTTIPEEPDYVIVGGQAIIRKKMYVKRIGEDFEKGKYERDPGAVFIDDMVLDSNGMVSEEAMLEVSKLKNVILISDDAQLSKKIGCLVCTLHRVAVAHYGRDGKAYEDDLKWNELDDGDERWDPVKTVVFHLNEIEKEEGYNVHLKVVLASMKEMEYSYFDGINNSDSIDALMDIVSVCPGELRVVCIPEKLKNAPVIQRLVRLDPDKNKLFELPKRDFEYYVRVCKSLLDGEKIKFTDENELRKALICMRRHLGSEFNEEWVGYFLDKGAEKNGFNLSKMFADYGERESSPTKKLSEMIGLKELKEVARDYAALIREESINPKLMTHKNMIFVGNPGSGKTTGAKIMADIFAETGVTEPKFLSLTRSDLIGKYLGHTAPKVRDAFNRARGGILFVDEADFLLQKDKEHGDFVGEAVKEFVRYMEECPDVTVVFAMYESKVEDFLMLDDGLVSRISRIVRFEDYSVEELVGITEYMLKQKGYTLTGGKSDLEAYYSSERKRANFGNARAVRKLVESMILSKSLAREELKIKSKEMNITEDIVNDGIRRLKKSSTEQKNTKVIGFVADSGRSRARGVAI